MTSRDSILLRSEFENDSIRLGFLVPCSRPEGCFIVLILF